MKRVNYRPFALSLLAALGLLPAACDGTITSDDVIPCHRENSELGFEDCEGGGKHRPSIETCSLAVPRDDFVCEASFEELCATDADCTDGSNGYCSLEYGQVDGCYCRYGCETDSDCGVGQLCMCGELAGTCVAAECQSDADCEGAALCIYTEVGEPGCGGMIWACQTADDTCLSSADCGNNICTYIDGVHQCKAQSCVAGRPFLVHDEPRLAAAMRRADWQEPALAPATAALSDAERAHLVAHWTELGLMEHASIAAFARFALQLLELGAPAALVELAQQAMGDEARHARVCFALASRYGAAPVGPGALTTSDAVTADDLATVVRLTVREGCIGETEAAIEAAESAQQVTDPVVREALLAIAADELRHAELAWRFIDWALDQDATLSQVLLDELRAEPRPTTAKSDTSDDALRRYGVLGEPARHAIRRRAREQVIRPVAQRLLAKRLPVAA